MDINRVDMLAILFDEMAKFESVHGLLAKNSIKKLMLIKRP